MNNVVRAEPTNANLWTRYQQDLGDGGRTENQIIVPKGSRHKVHIGLVEGLKINSCFMKDLNENRHKHM